MRILGGEEKGKFLRQSKQGVGILIYDNGRADACTCYFKSMERQFHLCVV